jgi:hypothetical protein
MKTTTISEEVFLHHQYMHRESRCYKIFLFQRYLSFLYLERKAVLACVYGLNFVEAKIPGDIFNT